jgi:hypothetical protein
MRLPYSPLGFLQHIAPSIQFLLAVLVFQEPFGPAKALCFAAIWAALVIFSFEAIRTARAINAAFGRKGKVFKFRYKAKQIRTREYARNVIAYVLNNWRRHNEDLHDHGAYRQMFDAYSSAYSFTGWIKNPKFKPGGFEPLPVSAPRTSLLASDWQWYGLVDPYEVKRG